VCEAISRERYGRTVARCMAGGEDLGAGMVSAGWAWTYTAFSDQYVDAERRAGKTRRWCSCASLPASVVVTRSNTE
jgi:endonuclease YncB( thermonuclease family)